MLVNDLLKEMGQERLKAALAEWLDNNINIIQHIKETIDLKGAGQTANDDFDEFAVIAGALWELRDSLLAQGDELEQDEQGGAAGITDEQGKAPYPQYDTPESVEAKIKHANEIAKQLGEMINPRRVSKR